MPPENVALILLAAGRSRRFGPAHKLEQDLVGTPVGLHVVKTLEALSFAARIAVIGPSAPDYGRFDFRVVENPDPDAGMSGSIALGISAAKAANIGAALIMLADMPLVTESHVRRLLCAYDHENSIITSVADGKMMPPTLFGSAHFNRLASLTGDAGARDLLSRAKRIAAPSETMIDIDTPDDLEVARARIKYRRR